MNSSVYKQVTEPGKLASFFGLLQYVGISLLVTMLVFLIFALLLTYTGLSESFVPVIALVTAAFSILLCGGLGAKGVKSRGYLRGGLCGLLYVLSLAIVAMLIDQQAVRLGHLALLLAIGLFGGAVGGIIGINLLQSKRH